MGLKFLIIVPHGFRDPTIEVRHNDRRAMEAARKLESVIKSIGHTSDFYVADTHRSTIDYNRSVARNTPLRIQIRNKIKEYAEQGHYIVVFEMHSFPDGYKFYDFEDSHIAFLSIPRYESDMRVITDYLNKNTKLKIIPIQGTLTNDIQWDTSETVKCNLDHYLIEFHEDETKLPSSEMNPVFPALITGVIEHIQYKKNVNHIMTIAMLVLTVLILILLVQYLREHSQPLQYQYYLV